MAKKKETKGFEFIIEEKDVLERENFGSFEIVITKGYACFKNYTGFRVFTTPYAVGLDGVAHETSLYAWLKYMVDFKKSIKGKENEMFGETTSTNKEFLDGMKVLTEANLIKDNSKNTIKAKDGNARKRIDRAIKYGSLRKDELKNVFLKTED